MAQGTSEHELREALARRTHTQAQDWFLVFKARYGMEVVFRALHDELGEGEVVTQLFTCLTAVAPIVAAGLRPRYADVSADTLGVDPAALAVDDRTRAVVAQHTFGIIDPEVDALLRDAAHHAGALLVEDNAHCLGRLSRDEDGHPLADVSIHSFGVEKMLPGCYFGGAVWVNPQLPGTRLRERIVEDLTALPALDSARERAAERYHNQIRVLTRLPSGPSHKMRARWEAKGTFEPAVADTERRAQLPYEPQRMGEWPARQALAGLGALDEVEARHRSCVTATLEALEGASGVELPGAVRGVARNQPLLRLPVTLASQELVDDALSRVADLGLYAVGWYRPLLLPGPLDTSAFSWDGKTERYPTTARLSAGAIDLPCDIDPERARAAAQAVAELASTH